MDYQLAAHIKFDHIYSNREPDFSIKKNAPGSTKKDRAIDDTAIPNSMPLLKTSRAKCPDDICFDFKHCDQLI